MAKRKKQKEYTVGSLDAARDGDRVALVLTTDAGVILHTKTVERETVSEWIAFLDEVKSAGRLPDHLYVDASAATTSVGFTFWCHINGVKLSIGFRPSGKLEVPELTQAETAGG